MVDLARGLDGSWRPMAGPRRGWAGFVAGLRACIERGRANIRRVEKAHDRLRRASGVSDETVNDVGLSREEIMGEPTWQADLPFFMQRNVR